MINDKIAIVTSPDYAHSSDYKICLVGDILNKRHTTYFRQGQKKH